MSQQTVEGPALPVDPVETFFALEDDIARSMGHEQLKDEFVKEAAKLKSVLEAIVAGESTEPLNANILLNLANMRRISRLSQYLTAEKKQETLKHLELVETKYLELQNSSSEIHHMQKEVKRCLEYSAGDEDLNMVAEDEFYAEAPENVSEPEKTKSDDHARYVARLNWELMQRKQLVGNLNDQETRRSVLLSDIDGKEQRLRNLKPKIASLIKAAQPIQDILGDPPASSSSERTLFGPLPDDSTALSVEADSPMGSVDATQESLEDGKSRAEVDSEDEYPVEGGDKTT